ncbi:multicopper oxidase-domain-containing protein [Calycina marina]|uniref:laccase n=1 Tax=Calycina marina TaxID=1763456 RepID=A0A9P7Z3K8_9HELO|nr:multicopper oxidase-domain-containing protein [Calycina marina]
MVYQSGFNANNTLLVGAPDKEVTTYSAVLIFVWSLDGVVIDIDRENSTLFKLDGNTTFSAPDNVIRFGKTNVWTYWVIQNQFQITHPMHIHSHDFSLLGQGSGTFSAANNPADLNFSNPTRRDTAMLIENGRTVIAFQTDNHGSWLLHCHIGWHVGGELSLQFIERESDILGTLKIGEDLKNTCDAFAAYDKTAQKE